MAGRLEGKVALVSGAAVAQQKTLAIGTGGTGGVYYPLGGAIASAHNGEGRDSYEEAETP